MPKYLFSQIISFFLIVVGWIVTLGGGYAGYIYFNKIMLIGLLPSVYSNKLELMPEWVFYSPAAIAFLFGLLILGVGHNLLVSVDNARFGAENSQLLEMVRMRGV